MCSIDVPNQLLQLDQKFTANGHCKVCCLSDSSRGDSWQHSQPIRALNFIKSRHNFCASKDWQDKLYGLWEWQVCCDLPVIKHVAVQTLVHASGLAVNQLLKNLGGIIKGCNHSVSKRKMAKFCRTFMQVNLLHW